VPRAPENKNTGAERLKKIWARPLSLGILTKTDCEKKPRRDLCYMVITQGARYEYVYYT
jgi:hypothetical protein